MEQQEWEEMVPCADCGATISPNHDRAFAVSDELFLCFGCAERRGGTYDEGRDCWTVAPDVADEPDERRPHA